MSPAVEQWRRLIAELFSSVGDALDRAREDLDEAASSAQERSR
ncbi:MAG: hypothetical protein ACLR5G_13615 [Eubacteriales bacterium]